MRILDRYILKKFLSTFVFIVLIFVTIICVIDFTEKNDNFMENEVPIGLVLKKYYVNFFPYIANMLSPITVFIATVFVTAKLAARTEIIAMLSSGMSFGRIMVPYIYGSGLIALLIYYLIGWVIPRANEERINFELTHIKQHKNVFDQKNVHMRLGPEHYAYMESYNKNVDVGYRFTLEKIKNKQLKEKLACNIIRWNADSSRWRLENCVLHTIDSLEESMRYISRIDTTLKIKPKDFESKFMLHETLTNTELDEYVDEMQSRGVGNLEVYRVERQLRNTYPFAIIILTLIGVIVSGRKSRQGSAFRIALGFVLAFVYILLAIISRNFAIAGSMPPIMAAWFANVIFIVIGFVLYKALPR